MGDFYINVLQRADKLLVREFKDGKRIKYKVQYEPTFFVPSQSNSGYTTLTGQSVTPHKLESIYAAKSYLERYEQQPELVYGLERFPYTWIAENYEGLVDWDMDKLYVITLDIEVRCDNGFPDPELANEELLCVTVKNHSNKEIIVWGIGDYTNDRKDVNYIQCENEKELMEKFLEFWEYLGPDVITGWNVKFFDIPYLMNRFKYLLGDDWILQYSPWRVVEQRSTRGYNKQENYWDILNEGDNAD